MLRVVAFRGAPTRALSRLPRHASSASAQALHEQISERFGSGQIAPNRLLFQITREVETAEDARLAVSAHREFVRHQRPIGHKHISGLVGACLRAEDWDSLFEVLSDSHRLQLHFQTSGALCEAALVLAEHGEWERLERFHRELPTMAIEAISTTPVHRIVIRELANAGELEAAARALAVASRLARARGAAHAVSLKTVSALAVVQLDAGDPAAAASTVRVAADALKASGWRLPAREAVQRRTPEKRSQWSAAAAEAAAAAEEVPMAAASEARPTALPYVIAAAVEAACPDKAAGGEAEPAEGGEADGGEAEGEGEGAGSDWVAAAEATAVELLSHCDDATRQRVRDALDARAVSAAQLAPAVVSALAGGGAAS